MFDKPPFFLKKCRFLKTVKTFLHIPKFSPTSSEISYISKYKLDFHDQIGLKFL